MNGKSLRIGVAGSGFGRKVLLPAFSSIKNVEAIALSRSDWKETTRLESLDAVALALPPLVQEETALAAAEKGLHLFCEKPLALHLPAAQKIEEAYHRRRLKGIVDFEFRKIPVFRRLVASLRDVGKIREVEMEWMIQVPKSPDRKPAWKEDSAQGGGAMTSFGCHLVDFCSIILGRLEVKEYKRTGATESTEKQEEALAQRRKDAKDFVEEGFKLWLSGVSSQAVISLYTAAKVQTGLNVRVAGERGALVLEDKNPDNYFGGFDLKYVGLDSKEQIIEDFQKNDLPHGRFEAVREMAREFVASILDGKPIESDLKAGVENTRIIAEARAVAN